jgi:MarR family transcriptional regulator, organic hydroperoxide resistance regulator
VGRQRAAADREPRAGIEVKVAAMSVAAINKPGAKHHSGSPPAVAEAFHQDYLPYLLARAAHVVAGRFHESLRKRDLNVLTWRVLAALNDGGQWTVGQLCEVSLAKQPTVSKLLDRLEKRHLIARREDLDDGRRVMVRLTSAGRQLIEPVIAEAAQYNDSILAEHSREELQTLKALLREMIARFA